MALVSHSDPDLRIYNPSFGRQYPSPHEQFQSRSRLLDKIHTSYYKALERLNLRARPGMAARFLNGGGFCLGFLDPVSNIVANTLISSGHTGDGELVYVPEEKLKDLERRSLEGMVTFLTRFFPYLADCEAVLYLLLADADLLVAARIIALDLGMKQFGFSVPAVNEALRCAALAAKHPCPDQIVRGWLTISRHFPKSVCLLEEVRRRSPPSSLTNLAKLLGSLPPPDHDGCADARDPWRRVVSRRPPARVPYRRSNALKGTLQDAIHGFYLKALARLPAGELRSRFHRSLLEAGHCYGPLDPVSNIIINTIWYDAMFPPTAKLEVDMISTFSLHRIENRSLYGLASFVTTRYHHTDFHQAMDLLLQTDACLLPQIDDYLALEHHNCDIDLDAHRKCDMDLDGDVLEHLDRFCALGFVSKKKFHGPDTSIKKAFLAAATAAFHPKPEGQIKLFTTCMSVLGGLTSLLQDRDQLSSEDVRLLTKWLCPESPCSKQPFRPFPFPEYLFAYDKIYKQVNSALEAYALMPDGEPYELHTICGVNDRVSGPVGTAAKCYHSHINFLATPRCHAGGIPVLFFAEVSNDDKDEAATPPFCCRVSVPPPGAERVRCLCCDYAGIRIVHPVGTDFHGGKHDFEKMVCGEDPYDDDFDPSWEQPYYTNMNIIVHSRITTERVNGRVRDDRLYDDYSGHESDQSDDYLSLMSDEDESGTSPMRDEYHIPPKVWAQLTCWEA